MNTLLTLRLKNATEIDAEIIQRPEVAPGPELLPPTMEEETDTSVNPEIKEIKKEEVKLPEPQKQEIGDVAPTLSELKKPEEKVEIKFLAPETLEQLLKRLPPIPATDDPQFGKYFSNEKSVNQVLDKSKIVKVEFPPKDQVERINSLTSGRVLPELMITSAYPTGNISNLLTQLKIYFSKPMYTDGIGMIHKEELREEEQRNQEILLKRIINVSPAFPKEGKWSFETPAIAVFTPFDSEEGRWMGSTEYSVAIAKGTKSAEGNELKETYSFKFFTPKLDVKTFCPSNSYSRILTKRPILGLEFTQDVDPLKVMQKVAFKQKNFLSNVLKKKIELELLKKEEVITRINKEPFFKVFRNSYSDPMYSFQSSMKIKEYEVEEKIHNDYYGTDEIRKRKEVELLDYNNNLVLFTTKDTLNNDEEYIVCVEAGIESLRGNMLSVNENKYTIKTMDNLKIDYSSIPSEVCEYDKFEYYVDFNNELNPEKYSTNKKDWISISGVIDPIVWMEKKRLKIKGRFKKDISKAEIKIKDVEDVYFCKLEKEVTYSMKVIQREFKVTSHPSSKESCHDEVNWNIYFSLSLNETQWKEKGKDLVKIEPPMINQRIDLYHSYITIRGNPVGKKKFTITVSKDLQSIYEVELRKDKEIEISIIEDSPLFENEFNNKMIVHDVMNPLIPVSLRCRVRNIKKIHMIVFKVDPIEHYHRALGNYRPYVNRPDLLSVYERLMLPKEIICFDDDIETGCLYNEKKLLEINLEPYLQNPIEKLGHVFVVVYEPKKDPEIFCTWIQATRIGLESITSNDQSLMLVASDLIDGRFIKNPTFGLGKWVNGEYRDKTHLKGLETEKIISWAEFLKTEKIEFKGDEEGPFLLDTTESKFSSICHASGNLVYCKVGKDICFIPSISSGMHSSQTPRLLTFCFDDKHIFKPTEKVQAKVMLRVLTFPNKSRKLSLVPSNMKIEYDVIDSRNVKVLSGETLTSDCSSLKIEFIIKENWNLGDCKIEYKMAEKDYLSLGLPSIYHSYNEPPKPLVFTHTFKTEEFKPPEFLTDCKVLSKDYVIGQNAMITASAKYYSGSGLSDCQAFWTVGQKLLQDFKPANRPDYNFQLESRYRNNLYFYYNNNLDTPRASYTFNDGRTNDSGEHKLLIELHDAKEFSNNSYTGNPTLPTDKKFITKLGNKVLPLLYEKTKELRPTLEISGNCRVEDLNKNTLVCGNKFIVSPCRLYIGLKALVHTVHLTENQNYQIIVTDPNGRIVPGVQFALEIFHLSKSAYNNQNLIAKHIFKSTEEPTEFSLEMFQEWGSGEVCVVATVLDPFGLVNCASHTQYVTSKPYVEVTDKDLDQQLNRFLYEYPANFREELLNRQSIQITPEKRIQKVNEKCKITIISPIVGQGLIVCRGTATFWKESFLIEKDASKDFFIPITENFVPNVIVECFICGKEPKKDINDFDLDDQSQIAYAAGQITLNIDPVHFKIDVVVEPKEKELPPSCTSELTIQTSKPNSIVTALIVDESVLAVTGYNLNLPQKHFFPDNQIYSDHQYLRSFIYVKRAKANLKKIEEEKAKIEIERQKRAEERRIKELERQRREEERKRLEEEERKRLEEQRRKEREEREKREVQERLQNGKDMCLCCDECCMPEKCEECCRCCEKSKCKKCKKSPPALFGRRKCCCECCESTCSCCCAPCCAPSSNCISLSAPQAPKRSCCKKDCCREEKKESKMEKECEKREEMEDDEEMECEEREQEPPKPEPVEMDTTPIQMRKLFESTVVFADCVKCDSTGKAVIPFKLPDNLTRYKIWALAEYSSEYFGFGESTMVTRLPFSVRDSLPKFMNFGDTIDLSFVLTNQTDSTLVVAVAIRTNSALMLLDQKKTGFYVSLPKAKRTEITFQVMAIKVGEARIQVAASGKGHSDAVEKVFPVYTPSINNSFVLYGELRDDPMSVSNSILPPSIKEVYADFGGVELSTTSTIFSNLNDAYLYVYYYMYDGVEMMASRLLSICSMADIVDKFNLKDFDKLDRVEYVVRSCLSSLSKKQQSNGGFGDWRKESPLNPYLSVMVGLALIKTYERYPHFFSKEKHGNDEYLQMLEKSKQFCIGMTSYFPFTYKKHTNEFLKSKSLYVLGHFARLKQLSDDDRKKCLTRSLSFLKEIGKIEHAPNETKIWLAYSFGMFSESGVKDENCVKLLKSVMKNIEDDKETSYLANKAEEYEEDVRKSIFVGQSLVKENASVLEILCYLTPDDNTLIRIAKWIMKMKKFGRWANTVECSSVIQALSTYFRIIEKDEPNMNVNIWIGDKYCGQIDFKGRETDVKKLMVPMDQIAISEKEKEEQDKRKKELLEKLKPKREEREKIRDQQRLKEEEERKKQAEEDKKKKKNIFNLITNSTAKDEDLDLSRFEKQVDQKKAGPMALLDKEEEEEQKMLKEISTKGINLQKKGKGICYYILKMTYAPRDLKLEDYSLGFTVNRSYSWITSESDLIKDERTGTMVVKHGALIRVRVSFKTPKNRYHVALVDKVPSNFEVLNPNLKTTVPIPPETDYTYQSQWYLHVNYRSERVEVFTNFASHDNFYGFSYVIRAQYKGNSICLPARAEEIYNDEICGQTISEIIKVI